MVKRWMKISLAVLVVLVLAVLFGAPNYAKHYIEKNSKELTGRQINLSELDFNSFNGKLLITDFRVLEKDDSIVFVQFDTLNTNITLYKLWSGEFFTEAIHLIGLEVNIHLEQDAFNFIDLVPEADTLAEDSASQEDSFIKLITLNDIQILRGDVVYVDHDLGTDHNLKNINIKVPGITIGDKKTKAGLEFALAKGGIFATNIDYDFTDRTFDWELKIDQLDLSPYLPYLEKDYNVTKLQGWFSGDVFIKGDLDDPGKPIISGSMNLNDFALTDNHETELLRLSSLFMNAREINLGTNKFHFGSLQLNRPYVHGIIKEDGDNLRNFAKVKETKVEVEKVDSTSGSVDYLLDEFRLNNGEFVVDDNTIPEGFNYKVSDINFSADDLSEGHLVTFDLNAILNGEGKFKGHMVIDPGNPTNGNFNFDFENTRLKDFSPYSINATAFPIEGGRFTFHTQNTIQDSHLESHLLLKMFGTELGDKRKDLKPEYNVPLKLGLAVIQDSKGRINIDVPAEGDINDPEFRYSKLIWKVVLNVMVKAATSPYSFLAQSLGVDEDEIKYIRMELLQESLAPEQTTQLDLIANILSEKLEMSASANLVLDKDKEERLIREYLVKRGMYLEKKYGNDKQVVKLNPVDKVKIMEIEEDEKLLSFLKDKTALADADFEAMANVYVTQNDVLEYHELLIANRKANIKAYMVSKELGERFFLGEGWQQDEQRNKPRFEMLYSVKGD